MSYRSFHRALCLVPYARRLFRPSSRQSGMSNPALLTDRQFHDRGSVQRMPEAQRAPAHRPTPAGRARPDRDQPDRARSQLRLRALPTRLSRRAPPSAGVGGFWVADLGSSPRRRTEGAESVPASATPALARSHGPGRASRVTPATQVDCPELRRSNAGEHGAPTPERRSASSADAIASVERLNRPSRNRGRFERHPLARPLPPGALSTRRAVSARQRSPRSSARSRCSPPPA